MYRNHYVKCPKCGVKVRAVFAPGPPSANLASKALWFLGVVIALILSFLTIAVVAF